MTATHLERLGKLDACGVSDAMDGLGLPPAIVGIERLSGDGILVGRVSTVTLAEGSPPPDAPKVHLCTRAIDNANDLTVIVVSHPGTDAGGWGGVLSNAAQAKGVRGVVVDGPSRDVDEARDLGFAIFARRPIARTARGRVYETATDAPVVIDDVTVKAGDYVIADTSGTVFIPADRIDDLLRAAEKLAAKEALMTEAVRSGKPAAEVMGVNYEDMLKDLHDG
ncbi:MAG: RraA family protein [Pseudomonadota bacterium]